MAGGSKEYELLFLLKAQVDASMRQFSVVEGTVKALEEKIQSCNATMRDIEGYRGQSQAIGTLEEKMRLLEAGTEGVNSRFNEATTRVREAKAAVQEHQAAIDELNLTKAQEGKLTQEQAVKLAQEKVALRESRAELQEATRAEREAAQEKNAHQKKIDDLKIKLAEEHKKLEEIIQALKKAGVETRELEEAEKRLGQETDELTRKQEAWKKFGDTLTTLNNEFSVMRMAANSVMGPVRKILDFYSQGLEAAGKLEHTMSAVKAIAGSTEEEYRRMTAVVKEMGATTVYTAEEAAQAMEKMALAGWETEQMIAGLPAVVKLAAAAGEDLAEMTSIVSDGMNAFHLTGERAAVKFADVLTKAATSANTNVALMGQSLSYVETTAGNLGYTIEDVALALASMANNALKGGAAGTALNTMLTRMSGANETAANQMKKMGLSMYDVNGVAKDLLTFLGELRGAFREFGEDSQSAQVAAYNLAGMRGMRGLMAIVNQTDEQWQKLTADVYDYAGAADRISNIRMDNYEGQVQLLHDAWDALETSLGEQFLPTATDTAAALRELCNGANEFVQENGNLVRGVGAGTVALGGMLTALTAAAGGVQLFKFAVTTLPLGSLLGVGGTFGLVAAGAVAAGVAVAHYTSEEYKAAVAGVKMEQAMRKQAKAAQEESESYAGQLESYARKRLEAVELARQLESMTWSAAGENTAELFQQRVDRLNETMPELGLVFDKVSGSLNRSSEELAGFMSEAEREAREDRIKKLTGNILDYEDQMEKARADRESLIREWKEKGVDLTAPISLSEMDTDPYTVQRSSVKAYERTEEELAGQIEDTRRAIDDEKRALEEKTRAEMDGLGITEMSVGQYEALTEKVQGLAQAYEEAWGSYYEMYDGIFGTFEKVGELERTTTGEMLAGIQSQIDYFERYLENLEKIRTYATENGLDLSGIWGTLSDGSLEARGYTDAIVKDLEALPELVDRVSQDQELKKKLADYQTEIDEAVVKGLEDLEKTIANTVEDTGAYDEAKAAMEETLDGYLAALEGEGVTAALANAAQRWKSVIGGSYVDGGRTKYTPSSFEVNHRGYAVGTESALRGWALVGEKGPELMWMEGGEKVLPADRTQRLLGEPNSFRGAEAKTGGEVEQHVVVNVNIPAGATAETIREARTYGRDVEKTVRKVLREERENARRRAME